MDKQKLDRIASDFTIVCIATISSVEQEGGCIMLDHYIEGFTQIVENALSVMASELSEDFKKEHAEPLREIVEPLLITLTKLYRVNGGSKFLRHIHKGQERAQGVSEFWENKEVVELVGEIGRELLNITTLLSKLRLKL